MLLHNTDKYQSLFSRDSIASKIPEIDNNYKAMPQFKVLCWKSGWLPFEYLMTDLYSGCLPIEKICYGNCTSAMHWIERWFNFWKKTINIFNEVEFLNSVEQLDPDQKWLRQWWASDFSYSEEAWENLDIIASILWKKNIHLLVITKLYHLTKDKKLLSRLANLGVEMRVSMAASDELICLQKKLDFLKTYRDLWWKAVPYIMTAMFIDNELTENQSMLAKFVIDEDFIAWEHPLRFNSDNRFISKIKSSMAFRHPKFPDEIWFGRIFDEIPNFHLPAPTHLRPSYQLNDNRFSQYQRSIREYEEHFYWNLPTYTQLKNGTNSFSNNLHQHATYFMNINQSNET